MDYYKRLRVRIPGLSFIAAAALTVALEAVIGIGASLGVASGLPSVAPPKLSGITSHLTSSLHSATSGAGSAVSSSTGAATSALHHLTGAASSTEQKLVKTATNLPSTAASATGSTTQAVTGTAGGSSATAGTSSTGSSDTATAASTKSGTSAHSSGRSGSGARSGGSASNSSSYPVQHPWYVRRLVTRLSGCVDDLPVQSQQVLVLTAGIGSARPNSASRVAYILKISLSREEGIETSAVTALKRAASHGSCESSGAALPVTAVALGLEPGLALASGPQAGTSAFLSAAHALSGTRGGKSAVRALRVSRRPGKSGPGSSRVERSALGAPSAASSLSAWIFVLIGLAAGGGFLLIGRQRFRARPSGAGGAAFVPMAAAVADPPTPRAADPRGPAASDVPEGASAAVFVPEESAPKAPEESPAAPTDSIPTWAPPAPVALSSEPTPSSGGAPAHPAAGRPRVRAGRNWLRRHRQAAAMIGAVAGATLALMVSTASRSARLVSRRRRRRHR